MPLLLRLPQNERQQRSRRRSGAAKRARMRAAQQTAFIPRKSAGEGGALRKTKRQNGKNGPPIVQTCLKCHKKATKKRKNKKKQTRLAPLPQIINFPASVQLHLAYHKKTKK